MDTLRIDRSSSEQSINRMITHLVSKGAQTTTLVFRIHRTIVIMPCKPTKDIEGNRKRPQQQTDQSSPQLFLRQRPRGGAVQKTAIDCVGRSKGRRRSLNGFSINDRPQGRTLIAQVKLFISTSDWFVRRIRRSQVREADSVDFLTGIMSPVL
jgi:hypothetical protein